MKMQAYFFFPWQTWKTLVAYPDNLDTTYGHMYALFTEERNESIDLDCLLIVLLAYMCCPSIFLISKNDWN